jgi:hypothetical protein
VYKISIHERGKKLPALTAMKCGNKKQVALPQLEERKVSSELSSKAVRQKTYMHRVLTILKEEGLYKTTIPQSLFVEVNKRISENYRKGLTTMKCVNDIAKQLRQVA